MKTSHELGYDKTMNDHYTCRANCDHCHDMDLGVMYVNQGEDILFECRRCRPEDFEKHARKDIDRWLDGGQVNVDP